MKKYLLAMLGIFVIVILSLGAVWFLNPTHLPIRAVTVVGVPPADQPLLAKRIQAYSFQSFFTTDFSDLAETLESYSWVKQVLIQKVWPDQVVIQFIPMRYIAIWNEHQAINEDGQVSELPRNLQAIPLMLSGPDNQAIQVLAYTQAFQNMLTPLQLTITSVTLNAEGEWSLVLTNGTKIELGDHQALTRLAAFVKVYGKVFQNQQVARSVDLRYSHGMAIEWGVASHGEKAAR